MKTFKEMTIQLDNEYKEMIEQHRNKNIPAEVWVKPWSEGVIEVFRSEIKHKAEISYWHIFNLISSLPESLKKEVLRKEILELNLNICTEIDSEISPRESDILSDYFIIQFCEYNFECYSEKNSDNSEILCLLKKSIEPRTSIYGSSYSTFDYYKGLKLTVEQGNKIRESWLENRIDCELWPEFDKITSQLATLYHYENMVASYEEMEGVLS